MLSDCYAELCPVTEAPIESTGLQASYELKFELDGTSFAVRQNFADCDTAAFSSTAISTAQTAGCIETREWRYLTPNLLSSNIIRAELT